MGAGLMAAHTVALPDVSLVRKSQVDAWVRQRGVGSIVILLQVLLQQAVIRKVHLEKIAQKTFIKSCSFIMQTFIKMFF